MLKLNPLSLDDLYLALQEWKHFKTQLNEAQSKVEKAKLALQQAESELAKAMNDETKWAEKTANFMAEMLKGKF